VPVLLVLDDLRAARAAVNLRIVTASAGSGKTHRLTHELDRAIAEGRARPEGVIAVTFTNQAAAELVERARSRLLESGRALEAHRLLAARIGTVNGVCGALVGDFAFELGLSPELRVLDEAAAEREFRRALARTVTTERADELERLKRRFDDKIEWRYEVQRVIEAARANGIDAAGLRRCAGTSIAELEACLGPCTTDDLDARLAEAIETARAAIDLDVDTTQGTRDYVDMLETATEALARGTLAWGDWASLASKGPRKKSEAAARPVQALAARHVEHPRLRAEMSRFIALVFELAADGLGAYQAYKRERGVIDFVDQEALALELLRRDDVRAALDGQIDLFLVDEFQDTSPIQLALFLELAQLAREAIWVGDPKQAIYGFRGTDPALMDAAIESLTSVTHDPDLVDQATRAVTRGTLETLTTSYRSRPALVALTSEIFARAFARQGMPEERTRLAPALVEEPAGLGDLVEHWPLAGRSMEARAGALAAGVRELLGRPIAVRARDGAVGRARPGDVAVLCRTNAQCQAVADALAATGIPAVVPRMHVLDTLEGLVVLAGLALWADPVDDLAAAELARLVTYAEDLDAFTQRALARPGAAAFAEDPAVAAVLAARASLADVGPVAALEAVIAATGLRRLCAEWGDAAQRLGNLDALRAHAVAYVERARAAGGAPTLVGLLAYLDDITPPEDDWRATRTDAQALLAGEDAVTVSTWHRAKGLEWPVTILFGLESLREPRSDGVHVLSERVAFDLSDPLGGRWIRYWPNPYKTSNQLGAVRERFEASPAHRALVERAAREALRVLYVGWTRARDRLVFAAQPGKLTSGILRTLVDLDPALVSEPPTDAPGIRRVTWADVAVDVRVMPCLADEPTVTPPVPGEVTLGRAPVPRAVARAIPSEAAPVPCTLGEVIRLGPRLSVTGRPEMEHVGHAVHSFLAADRPGLTDADRDAIARELLAGFGVATSLDPNEVVAAASRLWTWLAARFPGAHVHREWPIAHRTSSGTVVAGTADLVLVTADGLVVIDHKTFPGGDDLAPDRARGYSGQLAAYARALAAAYGAPPRSTWIHFPVLGCLVEVVVTPTAP